MEIREYGQKNQKTLLLLPPKYMTGRVFELIIRQMGDWHIFCVSLDGFEDTRVSTYHNAKEEAEKLENRFQNMKPFDVVFGHGLGAGVVMELSADFAQHFILSGVEYPGKDATQEMLKMLMPRKHAKILQKMSEPVSQREIENVLHSALPYTIWREFLPEKIMDLNKESVENAYIEDLTFYERLSMPEEKQKKSTFWHGQRQPFPHQLIAARLPKVRMLSLPEYGKDDVLFRAQEFKERIQKEMES